MSSLPFISYNKSGHQDWGGTICQTIMYNLLMCAFFIWCLCRCSDQKITKSLILWTKYYMVHLTCYFKCFRTSLVNFARECTTLANKMQVFLLAKGCNEHDEDITFTNFANQLQDTIIWNGNQIVRSISTYILLVWLPVLATQTITAIQSRM